MPVLQPKTFRILCCAALFLAAVAVLSVSATAQITKTARIELSDNKDKIFFGTDIYVTPDPERRLSEETIASRHENNLRGARQDSNVVNLGLAPAPSWMVFSVTNNSSHEDWILHFGSLSDGRMGLVHKLTVKNQTTGEIYAEIPDANSTVGTTKETLNGAAVPVKIGISMTELFVVSVEAAGGLPATFAPSLMTPKRYTDGLRFTDIVTAGMLLFFIGAMAFFATIAYVEKKPAYTMFSAYYFGNMLLFLLVQSLFFVGASLGGDFVALIFPILFLVGLGITWSFLDITPEDYSSNAIILSLGSFVVASAVIAVVLPSGASLFDDLLLFIPATAGMLALAGMAFMQAQRGKHASYFLAAGWVMPFTGMAISSLAAVHIFGSNAFFLNAYWFSLVPQALFFINGTVKKIAVTRAEERAAISRESRTAQSMARLKQSKETADQARLLRVIERERELMAELREQEMQRTEEMRRAKEMADHANRAKSAFLAVVSHEIRTPMTGIMGILRLMKDTKLSRDQGEYLLTIQKSSDTMMALLNDILDFEKIESGAMELEEIDFDLTKLVQGVVTLMSGHAGGKSVVLKSDIPDDFPPALKGDPTRVRQVLLNLVNNAIKFTENGTVTIRLRATKPGEHGDYEVYFGVEDTGIGISEAAQARLFTPFEQADASVSRKYGGTGLGLAICQRLVSAMGSSIHLSSQIGVGSTFFFTILMKTGKVGAAEDTESFSSGFTPSGGGGPAMNILVVEDNEINRKILHNFMEREGHNVTLTDSGETGLEIFSAHEFDAVFMDINLSGMNGIEVTRVIRSMPSQRTASTPIIALTGNVAEEDVQSFYRAGIDDFIGKPIDYDRLLAVLSDIRHGTLHAQRQKPKIIKAAPAPAAKSYERKEQQPQRTERPTEQDIAPIHKVLQEQEEKQTPPAALPAAPATTPAPADFGTVFDVKMLDGLLRSLGKDQMKELLDGFMQKTDEIVDALQQAAAAGETNIIYERAHELKGMAANFGMKDLAKLGANAEKAAKGGLISADDITKLPDAADKTKSAIQSWLK